MLWRNPKPLLNDRKIIWDTPRLLLRRSFGYRFSGADGLAGRARQQHATVHQAEDFGHPVRSPPIEQEMARLQDALAASDAGARDPKMNDPQARDPRNFTGAKEAGTDSNRRRGGEDQAVVTDGRGDSPALSRRRASIRASACPTRRYATTSDRSRAGCGHASWFAGASPRRRRRRQS